MVTLPPPRARASPRGGGARLGDALGLEPALRVDRGLAAVRGGRDRLPVVVVVDVAGDEDALDLRVRLVADVEIAHRVDVEPVAEDLGVGSIPDRHEEAA